MNITIFILEGLVVNVYRAKRNLASDILLAFN